MEEDESINSIINQLQSVPKIVKSIDNQEDTLTKENLEKFILEHSGKLIRTATESVETLKYNIESGSTPEEATALAEIIRAASGAIDTLTRIHTAERKNQTAVQIKEMDIRGRQNIVDKTIEATYRLTREELLKQLGPPSRKIPSNETIEVVVEDTSTTIS